MREEEWFRLHTLLRAIEKRFLENGIGDEYHFKNYNAIEISSRQVYRPKEKHKQAVFVLAEELSILARSLLREMER